MLEVANVTIPEWPRQASYAGIVQSPDTLAIKYKVKFFIDMFVTKFANGIGALFFLAVFSWLQWPIRRVSLLSLALVGVWFVLVRLVQVEYVRVVKGDLERRWEDGRKIVDTHVDFDKTKLVFDTIQSREKSSALYLMNLFDLVGKEKLTPELKKLIASQAEEFRFRSLDSVLDVGAEASGLEVRERRAGGIMLPPAGAAPAPRAVASAGVETRGALRGADGAG